MTLAVGTRWAHPDLAWMLRLYAVEGIAPWLPEAADPLAEVHRSLLEAPSQEVRERVFAWIDRAWPTDLRRFARELWRGHLQVAAQVAAADWSTWRPAIASRA